MKKLLKYLVVFALVFMTPVQALVIDFEDNKDMLVIVAEFECKRKIFHVYSPSVVGGYDFIGASAIFSQMTDDLNLSFNEFAKAYKRFLPEYVETVNPGTDDFSEAFFMSHSDNLCSPIDFGQFNQPLNSPNFY